MQITAIKTEIIKPQEKTLLEILDTYLPPLRSSSIVVITSKIVSLCEGSVAKGGSRKDELVRKEADYYLPSKQSKCGISLSIKRNTLIPNAGIDESNGAGYLVLWPKDPQRTTNEVREYLCSRFKDKELGVIITDSWVTPLRSGTMGIAIAHSGFCALYDYRGEPDLFGRALEVTQANIADGLAAASVLCMGEGSEQTPLVVIEDLPFVQFQKRNPTPKELEASTIRISDDLYAPLLKSVDWKKGTASS